MTGPVAASKRRADGADTVCGDPDRGISNDVTRASIMVEPALPAAHGPLSMAVHRALTGPPSGRPARPRSAHPCVIRIPTVSICSWPCACATSCTTGALRASIPPGNGIPTCWVCAPNSSVLFWQACAATSGRSTPTTPRHWKWKRFPSNRSTAPARRTTCATPGPGSRCANTSCTGRCTTSRRAIRTPGRFRG